MQLCDLNLILEYKCTYDKTLKNTTTSQASEWSHIMESLTKYPKVSYPKNASTSNSLYLVLQNSVFSRTAFELQWPHGLIFLSILHSSTILNLSEYKAVSKKLENTNIWLLIRQKTKIEIKISKFLNYNKT